MKWIGNTLVLSDRSLFTVKNGNLELRGEGWERLSEGREIARTEGMALAYRHSWVKLTVSWPDLGNVWV